MDIDACIADEERDFYLKSYPKFSLVSERKVHCTVCRLHIGTAPNQLDFIKMHPILRVTHCFKCHDFYNSGEFSRGEDGSELYCRWCGQGGEVFCCAKCPYVFCKSCITKNMPPHIINDIETNENWECFSCAPMVLWTLRAQHWALINYIAIQKRDINALNLPQDEYNRRMSQDSSTCCRLAKAKCANMSDSAESTALPNSRPSVGPTSSKKVKRPTPTQTPEPKRPKRSNDEVVCTPDLISMLEPDCQLTVPAKTQPQTVPVHSTPKIMSIQTKYNAAGGGPPKVPATPHNAPPPLVLRNTAVQIRHSTPQTVIRRTVVGTRAPAPHTPVYHTINGYRIDLNTAARQENFRLPNGKLIQVKRQNSNNPMAAAPSGSATQPSQTVSQAPANKQSPQYQMRKVVPRSAVTINANQTVVSRQPSAGRYQTKTTVVGNTTVTSLGTNGMSAPVPVRMIHQNGVTVTSVPPPPAPASQNISTPTRQVMVHHAFPDTPIGRARSQLQVKVFKAMEISQHMTNKIHTLTHSNAYKNARNDLEVKELYIHLSYLLTYSIGRFKELQDKCFGDMREFGFEVDADSLQKGQLAAGVDFVRYNLAGEIDVDLCGLAEKIHEYRRNIYEEKKLNRDDDDSLLAPVSPFVALTDLNEEKEETEQHDTAREIKEEPPELLGFPEDEESQMPNDDDEQYPYDDDTTQMQSQDDGGGGDGYPAEDEDELSLKISAQVAASTEESLNRGEENHAYDRKLTRLMAQYPSIWCTKHYDYGNYEVTRKQWRTICAHFDRTDNVKLRWKNIRKRFVRIEQRIKEGKRFHGYFDKATNFLANRDLPPHEWMEVDCGEDDGDMYERTQLDRIADELNDPVKRERQQSVGKVETDKPIDLLDMDLKIINFVKSNPILWRKSTDLESAKTDEPTRRSLWMHLWKSMPSYKCEEIIDRWQHLYDMYKTFRLKTIKDKRVQSNLELKYAKYLAKLFFLYKINEEDLQIDGVMSEEFCLTAEELETQLESRLSDQPDDREFVRDLAREVRQHPQLWNKTHADYYDIVRREQIWRNIADALSIYKRSVKIVKLRWLLAQYCYSCLQRKDSENTHTYAEYCPNLPLEEMSFLNISNP